VVLVCLALYGSGITRLPPVDRDESRFAQASRQMLESGDLVRIQFQDQPRHKKPIGIYWMQAASAAIFGPSDHRPIWPYRIPSLLGALLAVLLTIRCGGVLFDKTTAHTAGLLLAGCLILTMEAHLATTDAVLLASVVATQSALGRCYLQTRRGDAVTAGTAFAFWATQGLGWLLKGPVITLVSGLTICALCIADRRIRWPGDPGPGFIFFYAALFIGLMAILLLVGSWTKKQEVVGPGVFKNVDWVKVLLPFAYILLYGLALEKAGFIISTFLLIFLLLKTIEAKRWSVAAFVGIAASLGTYAMFELWLHVRLPKGVLGF